MNVAWNACFRCIFGGFYRESVEPLQFFCGVLPVSHFVHQCKLLFWKSMFLSENDVLASLSRLTSRRFLATGSLYNVTSCELSISKIKHSVWNVFVNLAGPSKIARLVKEVADEIQCRKMQRYTYWRHKQEISVPRGSEGIGGGRGRKGPWGANPKT